MIWWGLTRWDKSRVDGLVSWDGVIAVVGVCVQGLRRG